MANKDIPIDIRVSGKKDIDGANISLKELKKQLKEAQAAALNGDGAAARRVAELRDRLEDLNDATRTMQGSGVEQVGNSFSLLGEGLSNFDWDKIKQGFSSIGAAMKAIPIFLVAEGVRYLIENWEKLSEGNGFLAKTLRGIGEVLDWLGDKINEFTDFIGLSNTALDKQGEAIKTNAEKAKEALAEQTAEYDRQIKVAKAAGKSTIDLEKAKQEAIIKTNYEIAKQIEAYVRAGGTLDEEKRKQLNASLAAIKEARTQEKVDEITDQKEKIDNYKKLLEEKKKRDEERSAYLKSRAERDAAEEENAQSQLLELMRKEDAEKAKMLEAAKQSAADSLNASALLQQELSDFQKKKKDEDFKNDVDDWNKRLQIAQSYTAAMQGLSDTLFSIRMANTKKGSAEEEKLARKQFVINKALAISTAAINGALAVVTTLKQYGPPPNPISIAALAATVATTAASIAKISATQFNNSGFASFDDGSAYKGVSVGSGNNSGVPNINTDAPSITPRQQSTFLENSMQTTQVVKAYVVETESTSAANRVRKLKDQATF